MDITDASSAAPPLPEISAAEAAGAAGADASAPRTPPRAPRKTPARASAGRASTTAKKPAAPRQKKAAMTPAAPPEPPAAPPKPRVSAAAAAAQYVEPATASEVDVEAPPTVETAPPVASRPAPRKKKAPARQVAAAVAAPDAAGVVDRAPTDPQPAEAETVEPELRRESEPVEPEPVEPEPVEPEVAEPEVAETEPESAEAEGTEPEVVEPEPEIAEAERTDPEVVEPEGLPEPEIVEEETAEPEIAAEPELEPEGAPEPDAVELEGAPEPEPENVEPDAEAAAPAIVDPAPAVLTEVAVDTDVPAVRLRGVAKSFGETRAVDAIDLSIPAGTFYGVVGPNGAGKTTTLSMIAGLLRPDRGTIEVAGVDLGAEPARAKRMMGILPDRLRTFDRLTGRQLLHYYGVLRGLAPAVVESRAADLARAFDLTSALGRTVADYSAGMTKKVMLAGAMIHSPRVLVLDEPFEAVDPVSSAIILDILKAYVAHGGTVVLSSHGMDLVERVCSGVAVVVAGQVLAEGTVDEVRGELTLEQRFIELAGGLSDVEGLEWLHTFSG
jgi:ABC-2 type transport system ATP-binding protein